MVVVGVPPIFKLPKLKLLELVVVVAGNPKVDGFPKPNNDLESLGGILAAAAAKLNVET